MSWQSGSLQSVKPSPSVSAKSSQPVVVRDDPSGFFIVTAADSQSVQSSGPLISGSGPAEEPRNAGAAMKRSTTATGTPMAAPSS